MLTGFARDPLTGSPTNHGSFWNWKQIGNGCLRARQSSIGRFPSTWHIAPVHSEHAHVQATLSNSTCTSVDICWSEPWPNTRVADIVAFPS